MKSLKLILAPFSIGIALFMGCSSMTIVFTDSTALSAGTFEVGDVPIPAVSYSTGPRFLANMGKESRGSFHFIGSASITNHTEALGIYKSDESKYMELNAKAFGFQQTNMTSSASQK